MKFLKPLFAALVLSAAVGCGAKDDTTAPADNGTEQTTAAQAADAQGTDTAAQGTEAAQPAVLTGNTASNYTNDGSSVLVGDDIYYLGKDRDKKGLYRMVAKTGVSEMVGDGAAKDLTAYNGDIYMLIDGSIYKSNHGSAPEILFQDGKITDMCGNENWLYFIKPDDNGLGKVYKIKYTGTGETMVTPRTSVSDDIKTLTYNASKLYFSDNNGIGWMSLDGVNKTYLLSGYQVSDYSVYGDYLYYVYNGSIYRIKEGGSGETVQCNAANVKKINIAGDAMFIISDSGIGLMNTNGGNVTAVNAEVPATITVSGNYIFGIKGNYFYHMKTDGSDAKSFG